MRALVLGGTGHIGAHIVRALLARGLEVRATYRNPRYRFVVESLPIELVEADISRADDVRRAVDGCDVIVHAAGYYPRWTERRADAITRGIQQIRTVFDVLRERPPARIVFVTSAATIASLPDRCATEADREPWPSTEPLYATVKIAMEREVERYATEHGLPVVFIHPSVCLGEFDAHSFSGRLILLYATGRMPAYIDHAFNAIYTGDVAQACAAATQLGRVGEHYLASAHNVTLEQFARAVAAQAGVVPPRWRLPRPIVAAIGTFAEVAAALTRTEPMVSRRSLVPPDGARHWLDSSKAQRELRMPTTPLDETIARSLAWFREHGYAPRARQ